MLLLTYSYVVPKDKRTEHARLLHRMRQVMARLGVDHFEAYEQVGKHWSGADASGRVVQLLRFRDKAHFAAIQAAEKTDPAAQQLIAEFCELVNLPYQQQTGMFVDGHYASIIASASIRPPSAMPAPAVLADDPASSVPPGEQLPVDEPPQSPGTSDQPEPPLAQVEAGQDLEADLTLDPPDSPEQTIAEEELATDDRRDRGLSPESSTPVDSNGEADVLDYLAETDPAPEDDARR